MSYFRLGAVILGVLVIVAGVAVGVVAAVRSSNAWEARCKAAGGHVVTHTSVIVIVGPKGIPITTTTSDSSCLSADGRTLEV